MVTEALVLANTVATGLFWWERRKANRRDDPRNQIQAQIAENVKAIAEGTAGELLDERLNRVPPGGK